MKSIRVMKPGKISKLIAGRGEFINYIIKNSRPIVSHLVLTSKVVGKQVGHTLEPMSWPERWDVSQQM
jgi:hypothetical protein